MKTLPIFQSNDTKLIEYHRKCCGFQERTFYKWQTVCSVLNFKWERVFGEKFRWFWLCQYKSRFENPLINWSENVDIQYNTTSLASFDIPFKCFMYQKSTHPVSFQRNSLAYAKRKRIWFKCRSWLSSGLFAATLKSLRFCLDLKALSWYFKNEE